LLALVRSFLHVERSLTRRVFLFSSSRSALPFISLSLSPKQRISSLSLLPTTTHGTSRLSNLATSLRLSTSTHIDSFSFSPSLSLCESSSFTSRLRRSPSLISSASLLIAVSSSHPRPSGTPSCVPSPRRVQVPD